LNTEIKNKLAAKWHIDLKEYWIPLAPRKFPELDVFYGKLDAFDKAFGIQALNELVNVRETGPVFEFIQFGEENKSEALTITVRPGADVFYTNQQAGWVIYITHEGTIAIGGNTLLEQIKHEWPVGRQENQKG
jgi:hypothetical protein